MKSGRWASAQSKQTLTLLSGTAVAQLIALIASPLLTRLFGPLDFAALAMYVALLGLFGVVASGRYELAIVLPQDDGQALDLARLSILLAIVSSGCLGAIIFVFGDALLVGVGSPSARSWIGLLPLAVALTAGLAVLGAWANRKARYRLLAGNRVLQSAVVVAVSVAFGLWGHHEAGLIWGSAAGLLVACVSMAVWTGRSAQPSPWSVDWDSMRRVSARHADFPKVNLPHALLDNAQAVLLLAIIGAGWGGTSLGLYSFALRIVRVPMAMVGSAMGQVFQQHAASAFNRGQPLRPLVLAQWRRQLTWLVPLAMFAVAAPWAFAWLFGEAWSEAGVYALILLPWMTLSFMVSPQSQLPLVLGRQRGALLWGLAYQAAMLLPLLAAWALAASARQALFAHSIIASLVLAGYARWLWHISGTVQRRG